MILDNWRIGYNLNAATLRHDDSFPPSSARHFPTKIDQHSRDRWTSDRIRSNSDRHAIADRTYARHFEPRRFAAGVMWPVTVVGSA